MRCPNVNRSIQRQHHKRCNHILCQDRSDNHTSDPIQRPLRTGEVRGNLLPGQTFAERKQGHGQEEQIVAGVDWNSTKRKEGRRVSMSPPLLQSKRMRQDTKNTYIHARMHS
jgi:hypothetical protein